MLLLNMSGNESGRNIKKADVVFLGILLIIILLADGERRIIECEQTGRRIFLSDDLILKGLRKTGHAPNSSGSAIIHEG